jgi:deoxycytidine triphosphate deaminase
MALIPWIIKGNNRSVVTKEADFNPKRKAVRVVDFNPRQFKKGDSPNASYDLHVGDKYRRYRDPDAKSLDGGVVKLAPGEGVIIQTKEQVHFPNSVFGLILPKEGLLRKGLGNTPTKVDPGYGLGRLHITVFNHSTKTAILEHLTPFCTLCLFEAREDVVPYNGSKDLKGEPERTRWPSAQKWLASNWPMIVLAIASLGALILGIINRIMPQ